MASLSGDISEQERAELAARDEALPDGSYPANTCDRVRRAIRAYGRAPDSHRAALAELIRRQNDRLNCGFHLERLEDA